MSFRSDSSVEAENPLEPFFFKNLIVLLRSDASFPDTSLPEEAHHGFGFCGDKARRCVTIILGN